MSDAQLDALIDEGRPRPRWRRSRAGNLCRFWNGVRLTVYCRWGSWRWCLNARDGKPRYGSGYTTEEDAVSSALEALEEQNHAE